MAKQKKAPTLVEAGLDEQAQALYGRVGSPSSNYTQAIALLRQAGYTVVKVMSDFPKVTLELSSGATISGETSELPELLTKYVLENSRPEEQALEPELEPEPETPAPESDG